MKPFSTVALALVLFALPTLSTAALPKYGKDAIPLAVIIIRNI